MGDATGKSSGSFARFVAKQISIATPDGVIEGQVHVDRGPTPLVDLVPIAWRLTDLTVTLASRREQKAGRSISCRAGCGACCRQMVPLSIPECFCLVEEIESLEARRREEVLSRFHAAERRLAQENLVEGILPADYDDERALEITPRYFFLGIPCPLLEDESCGIYTRRPLVCRGYNVTSPAALCVDPVNNPITRVSMPQPLSVALGKLVAELVGEKPRLIPLTLAPRWVAEHDDLRRRTWLGLELFDRFVAQLSELLASR